MGMRGNGSMNSIPVTKFSNPGFNPCRLVFRKDTDRLSVPLRSRSTPWSPAGN